MQNARTKFPTVILAHPKDIARVLPHGPNAVFLDGITYLGDAAEGYRVVTALDCYDHFEVFKGYGPVLPGFKLLEMIAQLGAYWLLWRDPALTGWVPLFESLRDCEFKLPAVPGKRILLRVEEVESGENKGSKVGIAEGAAWIGHRLIARCRFGYSLVSPITFKRLCEIGSELPQE